MPASYTQEKWTSASILTLAAYISFVPVGVATVLLGPMLPILSTRWSLNYAQAGILFPVQYVSSTIAVAISGVLVTRYGFRSTIWTGLLLMASGLALLMAGPQWLAMMCIAAYGGGLGVAVPAANLMVAELNPQRRSATLNWLNFYWSVGAVACPFLVAAAAKAHHIPLFLGGVSIFAVLVAFAFMAMPSSVTAYAMTNNAGTNIVGVIRRRLSSFLALAALFFLYVGTENGFGLWLASFAKSLGSLSPTTILITPSFFYASLTLGRSLAPFLLRRISDIKLAQAGLILASGGIAGLTFSSGLAGVFISACAAGLGLSYIYPITIALLSQEFAASASRVGSIMFVLSNLGGGIFPWIVGVASNRSGTLKTGLFVPLLSCVVMCILYFRMSANSMFPELPPNVSNRE